MAVIGGILKIFQGFKLGCSARRVWLIRVPHAPYREPLHPQGVPQHLLDILAYCFVSTYTDILIIAFGKLNSVSPISGNVFFLQISALRYVWKKKYGISTRFLKIIQCQILQQRSLCALLWSFTLFPT